MPVAESFFSSLKKERIKKQIYKNRALALADVVDYVDTFCNRTRRHSVPNFPMLYRSVIEKRVKDSELLW